MSSSMHEPVKFHSNHGQNIELSEENTVARRKQDFAGGIVFSEHPIPLGSVFQVNLLKEDWFWLGCLTIGFTVICPDNIVFPPGVWELWHSSDDWILSTSTVHHNGQGRRVDFNLESLGVGQSVGCMVNKEGELRYFLDGVDQGVAWSGVTTDKPMWGVVNVCGRTMKVKLTPSAEDVGSLMHSLKIEDNIALREQLAQLRNQVSTLQEENASLQEQVDEQTAVTEEQRTSAAEERQRMEANIEELQQQLEQARAQNRAAESAQLIVPAVDQSSWNVPRDEVEIIEEIGRGGWGLILKGRFKGQTVAVKKAFREILQQPYTIRQMKREIQIMASVQHPNLVRFVAAVIDDRVDRGEETPLLLVELLDMDLRCAYNTVDLGANKVSIFRDVAYALHYLHEHQEPIIHRDVSAPNVLLECLQGGSYRAKLSDFGSANKVKDSRTAAPGAICYTAPEVFPPADPDAELPPQTPKIDVFSYGVMLAEVITKTMPTTENRRLLFRQVQGKWQLMSDLISSCTKQDPSDRPTMASILNTLNRIPTPRPRNRS